MSDSNDPVPQILTSQGQKETTANADFNLASPAMAYGIEKIIGLTLYYLGGKVFIAGVPTAVTSGTLALTASATNYVRKLDSTGVVSKVTSIPTAWPAANGGYTPLHTIVMGASTFTSWVDHRVGIVDASVAGIGGTTPTGTGFRHVTGGAEDGAAVAVDLSGAHATGILAAARFPALTGDVTTVAGAVASTLANTAVTPGSYGSGTQVGTFTVDAKGRLTAAANTTITGAAPTGAAGGDLAGTYPNPTVKASVSLTTPALNVATATSINKVAFTAPATSATLTIADGKTLTASNSITLAGTDSTTMTFPPASASIGYLNVPQNSQSTAYTTVLADAGKHLLHPAADTTARTFTIDSNANVAFPIGTAITFVNQNAAGVMTIAITSDTMRLAGAGTTGSRTLAANGIATALKLTSTEWIISGTGLT